MPEPKKNPLTWESVNRLGKSRLLNTSYIWLLIVPIGAKLLEHAPDPLPLTIISPDLTIPLALPFSWKLFYFSAVAISGAGLIYTVRCPEIIRLFTTYREYESEGRGIEYLQRYSDRFEDLDLAPDQDRILQGATDCELSAFLQTVRDIYWVLHARENRRHFKSLIACIALYSIGLILIAIVMFQNLWFVAKQTFQI